MNDELRKRNNPSWGWFWAIGASILSFSALYFAFWEEEWARGAFLLLISHRIFDKLVDEEPPQ